MYRHILEKIDEQRYDNDDEFNEFDSENFEFKYIF
uniref:Uncharacterized protein n=1 Tax=Onchocerca volvulus TaxID=6282 RepID=A0A044UM79_ONCVO